MAIVIQRDFHPEFPPLGGTLTSPPPFDCDECDAPHSGTVHLMRQIEVDGETIPIGVAARTSITRPREE
jgi:hypothetical protein